jgi:hypothetical protein
VTNVCGYLTEKRGGGDPDLEEAVEIDGEAQGSEGPTMTGYAPYRTHHERVEEQPRWCRRRGQVGQGRTYV